MPMWILIVVGIVLIAAAAVVSHFLTVSNLKKNADSKIGNAESKAREIIDDAVKPAEAKKKESLLEIKEESIRTKNELEKETKERRAELQRYEKRVLSKEESLDKKSDAIERREAAYTAKEEQLRQRETKVEALSKQRVQELERISGLTSEQAKEYLLKTVEDDVKHDTAKMIKELEAQAKEEADKRAKELFGRLESIGFATCLISNNQEPRVKMFNEEIGTRYIFNARKPARKNYIRAMEMMETDRTNTIFVGDQLFTDVWGAKRAGIRNILVKPMYPKEEIQIVLKRYLERIVLYFYKRKQRMTREE